MRTKISVKSRHHKDDRPQYSHRQAYQSGGYTLKEIGQYYQLHYSTVSGIIRNHKSKPCPRTSYTLTCSIEFLCNCDIGLKKNAIRPLAKSNGDGRIIPDFLSSTPSGRGFQTADGYIAAANGFVTYPPAF
jgi:hypothetical protein